ncbi:MAG: bifunctional folylpolyglutamate synthase/dihydrofolate synthase [Ruminiclostridium sp.]|nr:bifunctional folylpolyglutamate synthase/dihydrofolate synthase [Ruminiclostridium sp.]
MNYAEAVGFLTSFTKSGTPQTDLSRFRRLCERLGNPQERLRFLHIAGTNGKGSVCAYLDESLRAAGLRTGCFTSPFILNLRERIRFDGEMIGETDFAACMARVKEAADSPDFSQFELLTAAAFLFYDRVHTDAVVLETGIGGLYDCTALVTPTVSIITKIDLDHCDILGNTVSEIAVHKAGIIKTNVPAVSAPNQYADALEVLKNRARECGAPFTEADGSQLAIRENTLRGTQFSYRGKIFFTKMGGAHQPENAAAAIEALRLLKIPESAIEYGLKTAALPARMQVYSENPLTIVDGGHNESGAAAAAALLKTENLRPVMVLGMLTTKEWEKALPHLLGQCAVAVFTGKFAPNAVPAETLARFAEARGVRAKTAETVGEAIRRARELLSETESGGILIGGSLYLAGQALEWLEQEERLSQ